jgi:3D (Asp-Asp-Asp) domain-containing protein
MFLTRSTRRKVVATAIAAVGFAVLYEATTLDSQFAARRAELREETSPPAPGARLRFTATAYCKGTTTASGVNVRTGIAAADPDLLPVGSVIQVDTVGEKYDGIYTVLDTGPKVHGRHIDIYMWSCHEALALGRPRASVTVLRLGWNPKTSKASLIERLFKQREATLPPPPPWPPAPPAEAEKSSPGVEAAPSAQAPAVPAAAVRPPGAGV